MSAPRYRLTSPVCCNRFAIEITRFHLSFLNVSIRGIPPCEGDSHQTLARVSYANCSAAASCGLPRSQSQRGTRGSPHHAFGGPRVHVVARSNTLCDMTRYLGNTIGQTMQHTSKAAVTATVIFLWVSVLHKKVNATAHDVAIQPGCIGKSMIRSAI